MVAVCQYVGWRGLKGSVGNEDPESPHLARIDGLLYSQYSDDDIFMVSQFFLQVWNPLFVCQN